MKKKESIVILGGGPCGLYAARTLLRHGFEQVTLIDKGERPGGLATSHRYGENWYDMGVHMLHARDPEIFEDMKSIMGQERIEVDLQAKIKWGKTTYRYPLQFVDMIKGIPFFQLSWQVLMLFLAQLKIYPKPGQPKNAEDALIQLYGKPLYQFFFENFTHRYWGLHPRDISATFITAKMPKLSIIDILKKGLEKINIKPHIQTSEHALLQETLHYSHSGAETMPRCLVRSILEAGGKVIQKAEVKKIIWQNQKVTSVCYKSEDEDREQSCDYCISTLPINYLIRSLSPTAPDLIKQSTDRLSFKAIAVYGLLVRKEKCLDGFYVYYRDRIFHRIGEPKNAGLLVTPSDHTVLIVELTCEPNDPKWNGEPAIKEKIISDLEAEQICMREHIVEMHISRSETGYPIFSLGFEPHLEAIQNYISEIDNLQSVGRQGGFCYPNMHNAMRIGKEAAEQIIKNHL